MSQTLSSIVNCDLTAKSGSDIILQAGAKLKKKGDDKVIIEKGSHLEFTRGEILNYVK